MKEPVHKIPVEIIAFQRGERQSSRVLSHRLELSAALRVAGWVLGTSVAATGVFVALTWAAGFILYTPVFFVAWTAGTALSGFLAVQRVRRRVNRYRVGVSMDADAFALRELELVRPIGDGIGARTGFELAVVPGMRGFLHEGALRTPIEGLVRAREVRHIPLLPGARARVELDSATFVIECGHGVPVTGIPDAASASTVVWKEAPVSGRLVDVRARHHWAVGVRYLVAASIISILFAVPAPVALGDADLKSSIPAHLTLYQIELALRAQAQRQADSLHACFDPLPLFCQRAGYVGVGLRLAASGEVKSSWVARTTYRDECPVTACMEQVIAGWFFEPIREPMTLVIPVQVFRTQKPLPESGHAGLLN